MEEQNSSKKTVIIAIIIVAVLALLVAAFFMTRGSKTSGTGTTSFGALFGGSGIDTPRGTGTKIAGSGGGDGEGTETTVSALGDPLFRQLSAIETAGATAVEKGGKTYIRYVARANGYIYDVDPKTGASTQITSTFIPRVYEAYFALGGNTVILRYLKHDDLARKDIIKTQIADLVLPLNTAGNSTDAIGSLSSSQSQLPDNISSISISPSGTRLFYLLPVSDGVSGTVVNIASKVGVEVFRNSFSEWLAQMLDTGNIILTTKASAQVSGYSYLYNAGDKTLSRIVREKNGLTTLATPTGSRMLYSENLISGTMLSLYDKKGYTQDEGGGVTHTAQLFLPTLPEKCVWSGNNVRIYCGAFVSTPRAQIPDDWYQGALSFSDTFWTVNTDLTVPVSLADPKKEVNKTFDVFMPFIDKSEDHFYFIDKNTSFLWSMRLEKSKYTTSDELQMTSSTTIPTTLSPEEMRDALGSLPTTTPVKKTIKSK